LGSLLGLSASVRNPKTLEMKQEEND